MNRVSIINSFIIGCAGTFLLVIILLFLWIKGFEFFYGVFIWVVISIISVALKLNIADIRIGHENHEVTIENMRERRFFQVENIQVFNIFVGRRHAFIIDANTGRLIINYTRSNYNALLVLLKLIKYPAIEKFKKNVENYFLPLKER